MEANGGGEGTRMGQAEGKTAGTTNQEKEVQMKTETKISRAGIPKDLIWLE